jgi:exosortase/archaeosortase family protein
MVRAVSGESWVRRNLTAVKSIAVFVVSVSACFGMLTNDWLVAHLFNPMTSAVAGSTAWLLRVAGEDAIAIGQVVRFNDVAVTIATGCNGAEAFGLYLAAVLALPTGFLRKAAGLGIGLAGILIINQIRVVGLVLVAAFWPDYLFEAHNYVGQTLVIVVGAGLWVFWVERYAGVRQSDVRTAVS